MADTPPDRPLRGEQMDRETIDAFLREQGVGVLSLAADGDAYGVPVSFGYDGDRLVFNLVRFGEDSEKLDHADRTERASFAVYDYEDEHRWRSVLVRGPIERVREADLDKAEETLFDNAEFVSLFPPGEPMTEHARYQLHAEAVTGQQGQGSGG